MEKEFETQETIKIVNEIISGILGWLPSISITRGIICLQSEDGYSMSDIEIIINICNDSDSKFDIHNNKITISKRL